MFICFLIRVAAGCQLVMRHRDSPALLFAGISFSTLVSGLPSRLWTGFQCVWWKLLCLYWELAWKVIKFLHTLVQFFSFRFTVVPGWCVLNQSFVRTFFPSVTQSDVRSFVLLVNCCILLQITLPPCLELMTTMFMSALQTTSTMTMQRSFCTVKFCLNTEMFWWVLIGYFRPTFYPCFKASVPAKPSRENEQMDLSQLNCVTKLPGKIARQNCVTKLPRRSWPEVAEYTEYKQLSRAFAAGVALDSLFWVHLLWFV